ncbi:MAG TPA: hypothetical protein VKJ00_10665, partial [Thermoanaerobaculia bacterium]|nr:hypothetical protein [Thermoanaerobaculia bacterium]
MRLSIRSIPRWILLVFLGCPFFVGCCSQALLKKVGDIKKKTNAPDVALIVLGDSQVYFPDTQLVHPQQHI